MKIPMCWPNRSVLLLLFALLSTVWLIPPSAALADDQPVQITVSITDNGFDPATVTVTQGASVELTFVWAETQHPGDEHIIQLSGYNLASDKIDRNNTRATLKFVATKSGSFGFACNIECDVHSSLQNGTLKVTPTSSSGTPGTSLTPTKFTSAGVVTQGDHVSILGKLTDSDGAPVAKAALTLLLKGQFAGTSGLMEVGTATTGADGSTQFVYRPTTPDPGTMVVQFSGQGLYDATEASLDLPANPNFVPGLVEEKQDILTFKFWAKVGFVLVIGGVWSTLLFILAQAFGISRLKAPDASA